MKTEFSKSVQNDSILSYWAMIVQISSVTCCPMAALSPQGCCLRKFLRSPQKLRARATFLGAQNKIYHGQSLGGGGVGVRRLGKMWGGVGVNCGNLGGFCEKRYSMRH